jgi:hypothetical protein
MFNLFFLNSFFDFEQGNTMRYMIWMGALLSDVVLFGALAFLIYDQGITLLTVIFGALAVAAFRESGGFDTWRPSKIRAFLHNARSVGL